MLKIYARFINILRLGFQNFHCEVLGVNGKNSGKTPKT
jgi:hypothetical protein